MRLMRILLVVAGLAGLLAALGFFLQVPVFTATWPWSDGRLSYIFVSSILASAAVSMLWIGWSGELGALTGGVLNVLVIAIGSSIYFVSLILAERTTLLAYAGAALLSVVLALIVLVWCLPIQLHDKRPMPGPVRVSFAVFLLALVLAALGLILRLPVFPWALNPDSSVLFGCIFLGNATYFLYGLVRPSWHNALGQLLSFLAYDLVLIGPFVLLFPTIKPEFLLSLLVYIVVLLYSAGLAVYYVFIDRETRLGLAG